MMTVEVCKGCVSPKACAILQKCKRTHKTLKARSTGCEADTSGTYDLMVQQAIMERNVPAWESKAPDTTGLYDAGSCYDNSSSNDSSSSSSCDNGTTDWN
jgi:hypothetical protein